MMAKSEGEDDVRTRIRPKTSRHQRKTPMSRRRLISAVIAAVLRPRLLRRARSSSVLVLSFAKSEEVRRRRATPAGTSMSTSTMTTAPSEKKAVAVALVVVAVSRKR